MTNEKVIIKKPELQLEDVVSFDKKVILFSGLYPKTDPSLLHHFKFIADFLPGGLFILFSPLLERNEKRRLPMSGEYFIDKQK